jgi:hypothetical protein
MLMRDKYMGDPVAKYFPDTSIVKYLEHISFAKPYYKWVWNEGQEERWRNMNTSTNNWVFAVLCLCVVPIVFHKKIPGLKKFTSRKARVLWGLLFLCIPGFVSQFFSSRYQAQI